MEGRVWKAVHAADLLHWLPAGWPPLTPFPTPSHAPHLQALQDELRQQGEAAATARTEQEGARRQLAAQRQRNEAAAGVEANLEAQAGRLAAQVEAVQARQADLKVR